MSLVGNGTRRGGQLGRWFLGFRDRTATWPSPFLETVSAGQGVNGSGNGAVTVNGSAVPRWIMVGVL